MRGRDAAVELDVAAEVELVGDEIEVAFGLGLGGEVLLPVPLVEQLLRERIAVGPAFGIEARAGIAVPIPGAADRRTGFEGAHPQTELAQLVKLVEPRDAGADHDGIEILASQIHASLLPNPLPRFDFTPLDAITQPARAASQDFADRRALFAAGTARPRAAAERACRG